MPQWHCGNLKSTYSKWVPRPTSQSAQFLKVIELCGGLAPAIFHYSGSDISNLGGRKAKYLVRTGKGCKLTSKGKKYLLEHQVEVNLRDWLLHNSCLRYVRGVPEDESHYILVLTAYLADKDFLSIHKLITKGRHV